MSRIGPHLSARFGRTRIAAPSKLLMRLMNGFTATASPEVQARLAEGLWPKHMLAALLKRMAEQQQQPAAEPQPTQESQS